VSAANPVSSPETWQVVYIGGAPSPGVAQVTKAERLQEFDIKKGKGTKGATVTYTGEPPAEIEVELQLWASPTDAEPDANDHFAEWDAWRKSLKYDPSKKAISAIDISHPALADLEVKSVVCNQIGMVTHKGKGLYTVAIKFIEYRKPGKKSVVGTPAGSTTAPPGAKTGETQDTSADAQQKEIARLLAIAQAP